MDKVNVREIMKENIEPKKITRNFILAQGYDREAAMKRLSADEKMYESWFTMINQANNRGIPDELIALYEQAADILVSCMIFEKGIVNGDHR